MEYINIIIFIMVTTSLTYIITRERVFGWLRKRLPKKPFSCSSCLSVWIGFGISFIFPVLINPFISPLLWAMVSYWGVKLFDKIGNDYTIDDDE